MDTGKITIKRVSNGFVVGVDGNESISKDEQEAALRIGASFQDLFPKKNGDCVEIEYKVDRK